MCIIQILKRISIFGWLLILSVIAYIVYYSLDKADEREVLQNPKVILGIVTSESIGRGPSSTYYKYTVDSMTYFSYDKKVEGKQIGDSVLVVYSTSSPKKSFLHPSNYQ